MLDWVLFISISNFFTSFFVIGWIVIKAITFVKHYFFMKSDEEINKMLGRQLKRFRKKHLKISAETLAAQMVVDFPEDKIQRQTIYNQEKSPSWSYILWLHNKTHRVLNMEWLMYGEDDDTIPMIKI